MAKIFLKNLNLTDEEIEDRLYEYNQIINSFLPNQVDINENDYSVLRKRALSGDKSACEKLEQVALKSAFESVTYLYLKYDFLGYEFYDSISDVYLYIKSQFKNLIEIKTLKELKFFSKLNASGKIKVDFYHRIRKNMDLNAVNKNQSYVDCDSISLDEPNTAESAVMRKEVREGLFEFGYHLRPAEIAILREYCGYNCEPKSLKQVGEKYKLSIEGVSRYSRKALRKLRHPTRAKYYKAYSDLNFE